MAKFTAQAGIDPLLRVDLRCYDQDGDCPDLAHGVYVGLEIQHPRIQYHAGIVLGFQLLYRFCRRLGQVDHDAIIKPLPLRGFIFGLCISNT